jgi:hypothetical protein
VTAAGRLAEAQAALVEFESRNPRSREDVQEGVAQWVADARKVSAVDIGGVIAGGGSLQHDHLGGVVRAYVLASDDFATWLANQVDARGLLPCKKRESELKRLQKAVADAEKAIVREKLEADRAAAEAELAKLDGGG